MTKNSLGKFSKIKPCKGYDIYYAVAHRSQEEIDTFKNRYEDFSDNLIPEIFEKSIQKKVVSYKKSESWGSSHVIYFVKLAGDNENLEQEVVFRANVGKNPEPEIVMEVERLITSKVADLGLKTNRILFSDVSRKGYPFDYQIQEKLTGLDPEVDFSGGRADYDRLSYQLGEYVAKYHSLEFTGFGRFDLELAMEGKLVGTKDNFYDYLITCLDFDLQKLVEFEVIMADQVDTVRRYFEEKKSLVNDTKGVLNHHDLADHNLMHLDGNLVGIFDWEAAVIADPVLDLASCPTWGTLHPRKEQLLAGYQSIKGLPDNFESRENIYRLRTMIWKTVYAIRMDILTEARMERMRKAFVDVGIKL